MLGQVRPERAVHPRPSGQCERLHCGSVVRLGRGDDLPPFRLPAFHVVAPGELHGELVRVGPRDREFHAREPLRRDVDELAREALLRRIGEPFVVRERERLGLLAGRRNDVAAAEPEGRGHRATTHPVEETATADVLDPHAVTACDDGHRSPELEGEHTRPIAPDGCLRDPSTSSPARR